MLCIFVFGPTAVPKELGATKLNWRNETIYSHPSTNGRNETNHVVSQHQQRNWLAATQRHQTQRNKYIIYFIGAFGKRNVGYRTGYVTFRKPKHTTVSVGYRLACLPYWIRCSSNQPTNSYEALPAKHQQSQRS